MNAKLSETLSRLFDRTGFVFCREAEGRKSPCSLIERAASERAVKEIDEQLEQAYRSSR